MTWTALIMADACIQLWAKYVVNDGTGIGWSNINTIHRLMSGEGFGGGHNEVIHYADVPADVNRIQLIYTNLPDEYKMVLDCRYVNRYTDKKSAFKCQISRVEYRRRLDCARSYIAGALLDAESSCQTACNRLTSGKVVN